MFFFENIVIFWRKWINVVVWNRIIQGFSLFSSNVSYDSSSSAGSSAGFADGYNISYVSDSSLEVRGPQPWMTDPWIWV